MNPRFQAFGCNLLLTAIGLVGGCAAAGPGLEAQLRPPPQFPPDHRYSLHELIDLSMSRNPSLDVARDQSEVARAFVDQVKSLWLPAIRYDFAMLGYSNDISYPAPAFDLVTLNVPVTGSYNIENSLNYAQILATGGKRTSALKQARMFEEMIKLQVVAQQDLVACEVANLYYLVCLMNEIDRILDDSLRRLGVFREVATGVHARGSLRATRLDAIEADLLINQIEQLKTLTQASRQQAYAALKRAVGLDRDEPLILRAATLPPALSYREAISVSATVAKGFMSRPESRQIDLYAKIKHEQVDFVKRLYLPNIVTLDTFIDSQGNHHSLLNYVDGLIASLIVDVPIYDPANRARLRAALYAERASIAIRKWIEQLLVLEIESTAIEAQRALKTSLQSSRAVTLAIEHEDTARQAYSREMVAASDLVTAIGVTTFARVQHVTASFLWHSARARLDRVTGNREIRDGQ